MLFGRTNTVNLTLQFDISFRHFVISSFRKAQCKQAQCPGGNKFALNTLLFSYLGAAINNKTLE